MDDKIIVIGVQQCRGGYCRGNERVWEVVKANDLPPVLGWKIEKARTTQEAYSLLQEAKSLHLIQTPAACECCLSRRAEIARLEMEFDARQRASR